MQIGLGWTDPFRKLDWVGLVGLTALPTEFTPFHSLQNRLLVALIHPTPQVKNLPKSSFSLDPVDPVDPVEKIKVLDPVESSFGCNISW